MDGLARFNRVVTNPVMGLWAGRLPPWVIVEHVGRRSGSSYHTPVMAFRRGRDYVVALPYGTERDWVRNLRAAGGGTLERRGRRIAVGEPTLVSGQEALDLLPLPAKPLAVRTRAVLRLPIL